MEGNLLFYDLIQVALGYKDELNRIPSEDEWFELYSISQKHAVTGLAFLALEKLNCVNQPVPKSLLYEWIGVAEMIRRQNLITNERCREITSLFEDIGYHSIILKGQGNARMYPKPFSRTSGDIDIWVFGKRDEITQIVKDRYPDTFEQYHHIEFPIFDDVPVEVHYIPGSLIRPISNKRFLKWCNDEKSKFLKGEEIVYDGQLGFSIPSTVFNAIYQLAHIYTHFFIEGIGLRHFVDYYYVLKSLDNQKKSVVLNKLRWLGLEKFAKGVMWVEQHCLALEEKYLIAEPDEKIGKMIKKEMEGGGNFGRFDSRYIAREKGLFSRGITDTKRLLRIASVFPSECFWKIMEKIANQRWKLKQKRI